MGQKSLSFMLIVTFFIFFNKGIAQDSSELLCYDCDPLTQPDQCENPVQNGVTQVSCNQKFTISENSTALCVSAYLKFTGTDANKTGIYRDCQIQNASVVNFCDYFKQQHQARNIDVTSCITCNTTRCNIANFNGDSSSGRGSSQYNFWYTFLAVSVLFFTLF
ncbi:uncharacterized protein [Euwallacea fornicatus]|uniref:uncharacterized protein n=1 Tax=Euwallacea fornicatus TaxID=995702 RepID=UPI00339026A2